MTPMRAKLEAERRALVEDLRELLALTVRLRRQTWAFTGIALAGNVATFIWLLTRATFDRLASVWPVVLVMLLTTTSVVLARRSAVRMRLVRRRAVSLAAILRASRSGGR